MTCGVVVISGGVMSQGLRMGATTSGAESGIFHAAQLSAMATVVVRGISHPLLRSCLLVLKLCMRRKRRWLMHTVAQGR
jgi:hypothetical protein